jgi:hypothetical protein
VPINLSGARVESSPFFAAQFPDAIKTNGGKPLKGTVRRVTKNGLVVVKWVTYRSEHTLHPDYIRRIDS